MVVMTKRSQAVLPFFALNLVAMLIFFIVLLALFAMTKNVKFTIDEFETESAPLLLQRRIISTADCFAYEFKDMTFDVDGNLMTGHSVYPGLLDVNKLNDINYFNCMRKDTYDISPDEYMHDRDGVWDAEQGSGASMRYAIAVYDTVKHEHIFYADKTDNFDKNQINSIVLRVSKNQTYCNLEANPFTACYNRYGTGWDCIEYCSEAQLNAPGISDKCFPGRCEYQTGTFQMEGTDILPYWNINSPSLTVFNTELILPSLFYKNTNTHTSSDFLGLNVVIPAQGYRWISWIPDDPLPTNTTTGAPTYGQLRAYTLSCDGQQSLSRSVTPVMLKYDDATHPGLFIFESCVVKGATYDGTPVLENLKVSGTSGEECE